MIVDSPDFTHRVARRVRRLAPEIPILDYVSPSVWAWRPGRARAMRRLYRSGCSRSCRSSRRSIESLAVRLAAYVGHPLVERIAELRPDAGEAARRLADPPMVSGVAGQPARPKSAVCSEYSARLLARLAARSGPIEVVLPTVPHLLPLIREGVADWAVTPRIVVEPAEKWAAFRRARAALAASGTVTLELALAGVPMVAAYRLHADRGG